MDLDQRYKHILTFKDFKGFRQIKQKKERYRIDNILGEGAFGQVRKAFHLHAKIDCAIKIIQKKHIKSES